MRPPLLIAILTLGIAPLSAQDFNQYYPEASGQLIERDYYTLSYNEEHEQADWVAYWITPDLLYKKTERKESFKEDPWVTTGSANDDDYKNSGYQRGHLLPCRHMQFDCQAMSETFYFSNISPQNEDMNEQFMADLERIERNWVEEEGALFIITGPIFGEHPEKIGAHEVSVPEAFFKVYVTPDLVSPNALGMIIPNEAIPDTALSAYYQRIDRIEDETGIDFFTDCDDDTEALLDTIFHPERWVPNRGDLDHIYIRKSLNCEADKDLGRKVCINSAETWELETLPQIGHVKALRIIEARPFKKTEHLKNVDGIGPATYAKLKDLISL